MQIIVTVKTFGDEMAQFNFLIPSMKDVMEKAIDQLITLEEPHINIENLVAIHFTDDYRKELFSFQKSIGHPAFATRNKIANGHAQVVSTEDGFHIFINKLIPMSIMTAQFFEDNNGKLNQELLSELELEKNKYLRILRHELAHVEDENNQRNWPWLKHAFDGFNLQNVLRHDAHRLWEEYYACRRSNFFYDNEGMREEIASLLSNLEIAEKEVCDLRWKYNTQKVKLNDFIKLLHEYVRSAFIYCCYFMGHIDRVYEHIVYQLKPELYPSRFYPYIPRMWAVLRSMADSYPAWEDVAVFDKLTEIILDSIKEFEVFPEDTVEGIDYSIPVKRLTTRRESSKAEKSGI